MRTGYFIYIIFVKISGILGGVEMCKSFLISIYCAQLNKRLQYK